ncbi:MAG: FHA domain-containing protein [Planctomycetes bacterium]|nr:FHA domain-containing protein [Planctomycetota bacterium]
MPSLFVIQGRDQGHRFELDGATLGIGRDMVNAIRLQDTEVSRRHAELRRTEEGYNLVDLGSSNGTYVNGGKIDTHPLQSGDQVQLGRTLMLFTGSTDPTQSALVRGVDIVSRRGSDDSRIIRSMTQQEGSEEIFGLGSEISQSPWLARARSNLQVMYRTALAVSHTLDIDELLNRIMQLIFEWVEADRGCIMLVDQESEQLVPKVRRNRRGISGEDTISISKTILDYVREHNEGVLTSNARDDKRWDSGGSILKLGVREAICVPMRGRYGIVGIIYIDTFTPPQRVIQQGGAANKFSDEHLKLMIAIAHQAALAIEDTSYYSAMVQAERLAAVGQTIATLSHHIKNILQGIRGGSYLIEMGLTDDDKSIVQKGWTIVEKNQARISNLVMDMLSFSKERQPDLVPSQLNTVVADVVELMKVRADDMGVALDWQGAEFLPELLFDPEGMHRAILNVVTNAIDACESAEVGRVLVSTEYDANAKLAKVAVTDNGVGIEPEDMARLFTLFVSTKGGRGTGLGLSVSQKICKEHGGQIVVDSQPGKGSCFTIELPAVFPQSRKDDDSSVDRGPSLRETSAR